MLVPAVGKVNRVHLPVAGEEPAPEPSTCATINLYLSRTLQNFAPSATKRSRQLVSFCQSRRTIPTDLILLIAERSTGEEARWASPSHLLFEQLPWFRGAIPACVVESCSLLSRLR